LVRKKEYFQKVQRQPRWEQDSDQLALLGVAVWPSAGPGLMTTAGLAYAFQAVAEQQARLAFREEGLEGDPALAVGDWRRVDQPSWLESRPTEGERDVERVQRQLGKLEKPLAAARERYKEAEKPLLELRKQLKQAEEDIKQLEEQLGTGRGSDRAQQMKRLRELETKKQGLAGREKKLQEPIDAVAGPKEWLEKVEGRLKARLERYEDQIKTAPEKLARARRVGVWSDDYSNLLSVFSW
jgi:hypothetical protein